MFSSLSAARASASAAGGFSAREPNALAQNGTAGGSSQKKNKRQSHPSDANHSDSDRGANPFNPKKADRGPGGRQNSNRGRPDRKGHDAGGRSKLRPGAKQKAQHPAANTEDSLSDYSSADESSPQPPTSDEPFSKRILERLHKDGIFPPQWPENPGDAKNSHRMAQFRELHEAYRRKARASLTRAGLIDDPEKRKRLSDAIEFKGICEEMCPEHEKITRITELDVNKPEKDRTTGVTLVNMMVKKLARSAAGQEAPLPMDVRSTSALRRSLDYLIDTVLGCDENLSSVHPFLWDRTRAIRRDFAFFSSMTEQEIKTQVYVLENITRFHVTSLHLLSRPGQDDDSFVEQQELEQLGKTLLSLRDLYDDCNEQGIRCENEPEFRAYYCLFHGRDPSIIETLQRQWKPELWRDSDEVRTAVSLVEALQSTQEFIGSRKDGDAGPLLAASGAHLSYFRIVEDPAVSYTMACFAECHFPHLRRSILATVKRALARPKHPVQDITAAALNNFLRFDTVEDAVRFAQLHHFDFAPDEQNPADPSSQFIMLTDRSPLPHVRLSHQFSQSLVERKRGQTSLPTLVHCTVFEGAGSPEAACNGDGSEGSIFVQDGQSTVMPPLPEPSPRPHVFSNTAVAGQVSSSASLKQRKRSAPNQPFVIDSDDDDALNGLRKPLPQQQVNPFAADANSFAAASGDGSVFKPRARLPTFEEVKAMDSGSFFSNTSKSKYTMAPDQPGSGGGAFAGANSTKTNPFASHFQASGLPSSSNSAATVAEDPSSSGKATSGNAAKTNPFAGASPFVSARSQPLAQANPFSGAVHSAGSTLLNGTANKENALFKKPNPNPFNPAPEPGGGQTPQATSLSFSPSQVKQSPFAPFSSLSSNAATPPANAPLTLSGTPSDGNLAGPLVAAPGQLNGAVATTVPPGPASREQKALPQFELSPAPTVNGQGNLLGGPGPALPSAFDISPSAILPVAGQVAISEPRDTQTDGLAVQSPTVAPVAPVGVQSLQTDASAAILSANVPDVAASPPKDLLGDVNKWYVKGDKGLLEDFLIDSVCRITKDAFATFEREVREQKRLDEERRIDAEVERFRVYNLRLKFFYRWKRNAREKRLHEVARKGRDEMRAFYAARRAAEREAKKAAAVAVKRRSRQNVSEELISLAKSKRASQREARKSLLASGVLSGITQEREAAKRIVNDDSKWSDSQSVGTSQLEPSQREGPKTRALRKLYFGEPEKFRRSLPSMSTHTDAADDEDRPSNASSRWRLKAMGIVQLPDGTAVPESLAHEFTSQKPWLSRSAASYTARRLSATEAIDAALKSYSPSSSLRDGSSVAAGSPPNNKRKKPSDEEADTPSEEGSAASRAMSSADNLSTKNRSRTSPAKRKRFGSDIDDGMTKKHGDTAGNTHQRAASDAETLRMELRALRAELEEGTEWFKTQSQRLESESRTGTPWYEDSM